LAGSAAGCGGSDLVAGVGEVALTGTRPCRSAALGDARTGKKTEAAGAAIRACCPRIVRDFRIHPVFSSRRAIMFAGSPKVQPAEGASRRTDNLVTQLVGFRLDNEDYAIAITKIQEIILMKPITRIPEVPGFIEGLINLRGSVIPIVNLRKRFGLQPRDVDDETRTIVVNIHDKTVGCIVDAVTQVMRISRDQIQPHPLSVLAISHQYIAGLARLEDRLLIILDIDRLFDEQSAVVSGQWSATAE
jgi:purine-binding chemotaxis protein CheW